MEEHGYTVLTPLGQAGQTRVYKVRNKAGQLRVLKQLPYCGDQRHSAVKELKVLSSLRHPCIVPYHDSFLCRSAPGIPNEDLLCVVMAFCESDLREACNRRREAGLGGFEETQVLSWLMQLSWGLQHVHARHVLHRDLKPQNVLLQNGGRRALLADFGVVGQVEHTEDFARSIVGTPAFMSPEMLEGRPYNYKTDQWALGCVLYETMALRPPFVCNSYAEVVTLVLHSPPVQAPEGYSESLSEALASLLSRKPHDRLSNSELLRSALLRMPFTNFLKEIEQNPAMLKSGCPSQAQSPAASIAASDGKSPAASISSYDSIFARSCASGYKTPHTVETSPGTLFAEPAQGLNDNAFFLPHEWPSTIEEEASADLRSLESVAAAATAAVASNLCVPEPVKELERETSEAPSAIDEIQGRQVSVETQLERESCEGPSSDSETQKRLLCDTIHTQLERESSEEPSLPATGIQRRQLSVETDNCSYTSDFERESVLSSHVSPSANESPHVSPSANESPTGDIGMLSVRSFGSSVTEAALEEGDLTPGEVLELVKEAEAILNQGNVGRDGNVEAKKIRQELHSILGFSSKIEEALEFMRIRKPLGDTLESDELIMQVELLDKLGEDGIRALPLMERLIELEGKST